MQLPVHLKEAAMVASLCSHLYHVASAHEAQQRARQAPLTSDHAEHLGRDRIVIERSLLLPLVQKLRRLEPMIARHVAQHTY